MQFCFFLFDILPIAQIDTRNFCAPFPRIRFPNNFHRPQLNGVHGVSIVAHDSGQTCFAYLVQLICMIFNINIRILIDILDYTGSETDGCVVRLVPETVADFGSQELIGNNATAYRAENSVVFRRGNFRQNSDVEINVPNIPSISK